MREEEPRGISSDFQSRDVDPIAQARAHLLTPWLTAPSQLAPCRLAAFGHYHVQLSYGTKRVPTRPGAQAGRGPQGSESVCVEGATPRGLLPGAAGRGGE